MDKEEVIRWANTLQEGSRICISEEGLSIVEVDRDEQLTGAYLEIGLTPQDHPNGK